MTRARGKVSGHTPGPWYVGSPFRSIVCAPGNIVIAETIGDVDDESVANASLIATAPELRAGIDKILWLLDNNPPGTCDETIRGICDALLTKAEGRE